MTSRASTRRTPSSRAAPTTPACTASARACPTTRACSSTCPRARWRARCSSCAPGPRRSPTAPGPASATGRRATPTASGARSASAIVTASAPRSAPSAQECFVELARERAHRSHLIVTNHSLLAIDAIEGVPMIPDYDVAVIDEAHELTARVTQAATDELSAADVERAARRSQRHVEGSQADDLADAADALRDAISEARPGRFDRVPEQLADALVLVRDAARACLSAYPGSQDSEGADAGLTQAKGTVQEVFVTAERMAAGSDADVLWLSEGGDRIPPRMCVAPLQVWGPHAREAAHRQDRRDDLGDPDARRRLLDARHQRRAPARRAGARRRRRRARRGRPALDRPRRRIAVRLRPAGDPLRRPPPAAARPRRPRQGPARRDRRARRRRRGPHPGALLVAAAAPRPPPRRSAAGSRT